MLRSSSSDIHQNLVHSGVMQGEKDQQVATIAQDRIIKFFTIVTVKLGLIAVVTDCCCESQHRLITCSVTV